MASQITSKTTSDPDKAEKDLKSAREVLELEARAITDLAESLGQNFVEAIDIIENTTGRLIVSGMGKSGHVGRKIAATFASTGTPAQFVHPGEASHGDLGMIQPTDAVLLLSNSGETQELSDLIRYTKRFTVPLIGVASKADSTLIRSSDVGIVLPPMQEACPINKAPTTSTTVTLALGDAMAVAMMYRRGFTADDYRVFHPGGKLGASLMRVSDLMHTGEELPLVSREMKMNEVLISMTTHGFGVAGVLDEGGGLAGIITDGDLRRHMSADFLEKTAGEIMTASPRCIGPSALATEAMAVMNSGKRQITCLFVQEEWSSEPIGLLHMHDCLRAGVV